MDPTVSVILPTYNRSKTLAAAMTSVLTQSYRDLELIVVDDASTEDIAQVLAGFSDDRIRYLRRDTNGGAGAARNSGLVAAKGRFIAFQDSDDLWLPGKLQRQMAFFAILPDRVRVVTGGKILYGRDRNFQRGPGKVVHAPDPAGALRLGDDQLAKLLRENRLSVQNALFRRDCMPTQTWFDGSLRANEDWEFAVRLVQHTAIYEDVEPVVLGFISPDSISSNPRRQLKGLLKILRTNRRVLATRRLDRSRLRIEFAIDLHRLGRRRLALRFLVEGVKDRPANIVAVMLSVYRRFSRIAKESIVDGLTQAVSRRAAR
ncbi:glycosyltransferase family 2 protein [Rhizobium sp. 57MFTsu3.2]|uniref:glycosyltransferase family 2 protein n=1 Tax=Rhizobium sp. 57MFTsu3.2 TaxID=1048681 RepID=UPI00146CA2E2|nr:glycosyltransferase family 2 protein [Rhizobium sp. 57MFTsu3.2]NMN73129.1 glycosyltransferase involved in cell wall biosynthesis [Rhizobium sp. 57MFTsu3.2]